MIFRFYRWGYVSFYRWGEIFLLGGETPNICLFSPRTFGEDESKFDGCVVFKWVGEKPPTSQVCF